MIIKEYTKFKSSNKYDDIHTVIWNPDSEKYPEPIAILQISHGMIDHIERYEALAEYMAERGFLVVGNDHLGHGKSVKGKEGYGYFTKGNDPGKYVVKDLYKLTCIMKKKYPDIPLFLLGHSMGSFMARRYMSEHGDVLTGAIILGTGNQPWALVQVGRLITYVTQLLKGDRYRSRCIDAIMFGAYNKRIKNSTKKHDWLTADASIVTAYESDSMCDYIFTTNGYMGLLNTIAYVKSKRNICKVPSDLPVLLASGMDDPVGNYGTDVKRLFDIYRKHFDDVELRLYEGCRHELHSEVGKEDIFEDLYTWMMNQ